MGFGVGEKKFQRRHTAFRVVESKFRVCEALRYGI